MSTIRVQVHCLDPEERCAVEGELRAHRFWRDAAQACELVGDVGHEPRGVWPGESVRLGRQKRRIRFHHDAVNRGQARGFLRRLCVLVGEYAGETDHCAEVEEGSHFGGASGEAVEDEPIRGQARTFEDRNEVAEGVAAVEDDGFGHARAFE